MFQIKVHLICEEGCSSRQDPELLNIRSRNTSPEVSLRQASNRAECRFQIYTRVLPGLPDIVLPNYNNYTILCVDNSLRILLQKLVTLQVQFEIRTLDFGSPPSEKVVLRPEVLKNRGVGGRGQQRSFIWITRKTHCNTYIQIKYFLQYVSHSLRVVHLKVGCARVSTADQTPENQVFRMVEQLPAHNGPFFVLKHPTKSHNA